MEFRFDTKYDQKGLTVMARALRKTIRKKRSRRSHIFGWCVVALGIVVTAAQIMIKEPWTLRNTVTCGVILVLLATLFGEDQINAYFAKKRMLPGTSSAKSVFAEKNYTSSTEVSASEFRYDTIQCICETEEYFVFLLGRQHGQIYDKAALSGGTVEAFRAFITEKTGKPIAHIK